MGKRFVLDWDESPNSSRGHLEILDNDTLRVMIIPIKSNYDFTKFEELLLSLVNWLNKCEQGRKLR